MWEEGSCAVIRGKGDCAGERGGGNPGWAAAWGGGGRNSDLLSWACVPGWVQVVCDYLD